jgi:hypothetical protein
LKKLKKLKFGAFVALFIAIMTIASGCSLSYAEPSCAEVTEAVMSQIEFPSPSPKDINTIGAYYALDPAKIADMSVYVCASGAYPDEIAVVKFIDNPGAKLGLEAVNLRADELRNTFIDYTPEEMYKLKNPVIEQYGNYVVLCASSDNEKAAEIIENCFKTK